MKKLQRRFAPTPPAAIPGTGGRNASEWVAELSGIRSERVSGVCLDEADGVYGEGSGRALKERSDINQHPSLPLFAADRERARAEGRV